MPTEETNGALFNKLKCTLEKGECDVNLMILSDQQVMKRKPVRLEPPRGMPEFCINPQQTIRYSSE